MLLKIKLENGSIQLDEWCIIEFQGEFHGEPFNSQDLGNLIVKESNVTIDIGMHSLIGKIKDLAKPFLIFNNKANDDVLNCIGVVKKKIVFNTRPNQKLIKAIA